MFRDHYYNLVAKILCVIVLSVLLGRLTLNGFMVVLVLCGVMYAFSRKPGKAMVIYAIFPLFAIMNFGIFPRTGIYLLVARVGTVLMAFCMMMNALGRRGEERIPLGSLYLYLLVAGFCSIYGYAPRVSWLKIINVSFFVGGIMAGMSNLHKRYDDLVLVRATIMAVAVFVIAGSLLTIPFPAICYLTSIDSYYIDEYGIDEAAAMMMASGKIRLFGGITNQSQALSPIVACLSGWLLCDMLFIERKFSWPHVILLGISPVMLYMTRSRTGLLAFVVMLFVVLVYCAKKIRIPDLLRQRLRPWVAFGCVLLVVGAVVSEVRNGSLTAWIRKSTTEEATLGEAFMASRVGKIEENLQDFKRSPLLGSGFQVNYLSSYIIKTHGKGGWGMFSAPVEKSVAPVMILGETGILGAIVFIGVLFAFYGGCIRKRYFVTMTLFTVFLATNMAEATIFAPAGAGGIEWIICVAGGFAIDLLVKYDPGKMMLYYMQQQGSERS